jgi:hypothetical protein
VDKVALGHFFSEYFGFPCQSSFHQLLHNHPHLSSGAGTVGQKLPQCKGSSPTPLAIKKCPYLYFPPTHACHPSCLSLSGFSTKILYAILFAPIRATCHTHPILHYLIVLIIFVDEYKLWNSSLCSFLQPPITSLFGPNILLSTLFANTFSFLNVRDQVSHP